MFGVCAAWLIAASQINPLLLPRFGTGGVLRGGAPPLALRHHGADGGRLPRAWRDLGGAIPLFFNLSASAWCWPNATVRGANRHAAHAGSASAVMGTLQFVLGAVSGLLVGVLSDGSVRPMALLLLAGAIGANIADLLRPRT